MKERKKRRTRKRCRARAGANRSHGREESRLPRVGTTLLLLHHHTFKNTSASHSSIARRPRYTNQTPRRITLDCNYTHTHTHTHTQTPCLLAGLAVPTG